MLAELGAAEWSSQSHISQTFDANDNLPLDPDSPGTAYGSVSALVLDLYARMPTLSVHFAADANYRTYWGEGATEAFDGGQAGVSTKIDKTTRLTDYDLLFSWRRELASTSELLDSGRLDVDASRITTFGQAGLTHRLNHKNSLAWSTTAQAVDFTAAHDELTPFTDLATTGSWIRHLSRTTNVAASVGLEWYDADNPTETESTIVSATADLTSQVSKRLVFKGKAGFGVRDTEEIDLSDPMRPTTSETTGSYLADVDLIYSLKRTEISLSASHAYWPSSLGELQKRASVGLSIDHQLNELSSLLLSSLYSHQTDDDLTLVDGDRDLVILSAVYAYRLGEYWHSELGYRFIRQDDEDGIATSNSFFLTVKRDLTLMP